MHGLEASMLRQLKEIVDTQNRFGVGFASSEAWDVIQTKVSAVAHHEWTLFIRRNDKRKCNTVIGNTINNDKKKHNKHLGMKDDLHRLFGHIGSV